MMKKQDKHPSLDDQERHLRQLFEQIKKAPVPEDLLVLAKKVDDALREKKKDDSSD